MNEIKAYISEKDKVSRILYSEISCYLYSLNPQSRGIFVTNVEKLLDFSMKSAKGSFDDSDISDDVSKIVVKIYDHSQLIAYQLDNVHEVFVKKIAEENIGLHNEIKNIEKEYITILGIFAAIMLAFVGTFTFSNSVLSNVSNAGVFKIGVLACVVGIVFFNIINLLIQFLREINNKVKLDDNKKPKVNAVFWPVNIIFIIATISFLFLHEFIELDARKISNTNPVTQQEEQVEEQVTEK